MLIYELLNNINSETVSIIDDEGEWDIRYLHNEVKVMADIMEKAGVNKKDRVAIILGNSSFFIISLFAVLKLEAVPVPIHMSTPDTIVELMLQKVEVNYVITHSIHKKQYKKYYITQKHNKIEIFKAEDTYSCKNTPDNTALILFSSGTSSDPKGIVLSNQAVINNICSIQDYMKASNKDIILILKSVNHVSTIVGEILLGFFVGAKLILKKEVVSPNITLNRIEQYQATILVGNPSIYRLIILKKENNFNVTSVRLIYTCAAPADKDILNELEKYFLNASILNVYGLTEAGPRVTAQIKNKKSEYGSVGLPIKNVNVKLVHNKKEITEPNKIGMLWIFTNALMTGYYNDQKKTKSVVKNGWLISGDLAYYDHNKEIHIMGREDDVFTRNGNNINPVQIENLLKENLKINNCVIFGVTDSVLGNRIICVIEKNNENDIEKNTLYQFFDKFLLQVEKPDEIYFWDYIPRTLTNKISRVLSLQYYMKLKGVN